MYKQIEKSNENKCRTFQNSITQKKNNRKQSFGFMDNRLKSTNNKKLYKNYLNVNNQIIIQLITKNELEKRANRIKEMAKNAPESGCNLWKVTHNNGGVIYLLGTEHGLSLSDMGEGIFWLINFLQTENFTKIFTEKETEIAKVKFNEDLNKNLKIFIEIKKKYENDLIGNDERKKNIAKKRIANNETHLGDWNKLKLDQAYLSLASIRKEKNKKDILNFLETQKDREKLNKKNIQDEVKTYKSQQSKDEDVKVGNQKNIFTDVYNMMQEGIDLASCEERNKMWIEKYGKFNKNDKQLWIVGAAHLPGLILRFRDLKMEVKHMDVPKFKKNKENE